MRLTITTDDGNIYNVEVDSQMELDNLKALLEAESSIAVGEQELFYNGRYLADDKLSLEQIGVGQDDMLLLRKRAQQPVGAPNTGNDHVDLMRQRVLSDPRLLQQLANTSPELANAAMNDPQRFAAMVQQIAQNRRQAEMMRSEHMSELASDPFDIGAQRKIEEDIKRENIAANLEAAMEYNPESFARVTRLYVRAEINGRQLVALVDSGAQSTVISPETAEACGLLRLMDTRFSGVAQGVGTAKILGRIHSAQMKLDNNVFVACSFYVVEGKGSEMLFGLDMLKRHQASIDLRKDALIIADAEILFLKEHELPERQRMIEVHGGVTDETPMASRMAAPTAANAAAHPPASSSNPTSSASAGSKPAFQGSPTTIPSNPPQQPQLPESSIQTLTNLGISRQEAVHALQATGGNVDLAASFLFQVKLAFTLRTVPRLCRTYTTSISITYTPAMQAHIKDMLLKAPKYKFTYKSDPDGSIREAAVLVPLCHVDNEASILFTVRHSDMRSHAGEVSFPGGKSDPEDPAPLHTALRETAEEISITPASITLLGETPPLPNRGRTLRVHPFIGLIHNPQNLIINQIKHNPDEVDRCFALSLRWLLDPRNKHVMTVDSGVGKVKMPAFRTPDGEIEVWGLTAMILDTFLRQIHPLPSST
ncbi:hypothetical protein BZG36_01627 [Bifiguratus adelaidae]|uniref:DNA damage-inducible protein 1 n=1 Tax=Bifiguratus adelaidae TaxID=1938954 RepID=A0A261Y4J2_9FUNG|nr:hypothetical protein BZG36_01627 [Bifiguratus adelaidae]